jgi:hypothetical protein
VTPWPRVACSTCLTCCRRSSPNGQRRDPPSVAWVDVAESQRNRQPLAILVAVVLVAAVAALRWDLIRPYAAPHTRSDNPQPCIDWRVQTDFEWGERCSDRLRNDVRRAPVDETRRTAEAPAAIALARAVAPEYECLWQPGGCRSAPPTRRPSSDDVTSAYKALSQLGHPATAVRIARITDPASPGALIYAARLASDLCAVGSVNTLPYDRANVDLVGPYPDGTCLDP